MDTLLIVVTVIALAMAIAMSGVVIKLLRDERRRSAARVAALAEAAETRAEPGAHVPRAQTAHLSIDPREPAWDARDLDLNVAPRTLHVAREHVAPGTSHVAREHVAPGTSDIARDTGAGLFAAPSPSSPWGTRLAVAAALAAIVGFGGYALLHRSTARASQPAALAQSAPLELLSLAHKQQPDSLVVTGLVQNPHAAAPISHVVATAFLFAADNTFLGSGRAALDYSTLAPGDESPFVITVAVSAPVARYRVGFRDESGRVIAHVDRRADGTMAQIAR